mmetsp:Transcript_35192/g.92197  ORF Transcript_35192/g.92197 Transcript_35192/m.92197 type:complete len:471 (-) Transcript_35192:26-1438(-)
MQLPAVLALLAFANGRVPVTMLRPSQRGGRLARERFGPPVQSGILQWLEVPLDHFNETDLRTMRIRWYSDASVFDNRTGPIFVDMGGEGPQTGVRCSSRAADHNALCVAVEHRFYGQSLPEGGLSEGNMRYLTVEQNLADTAMVIDTIRAQLGDSSRAVANFGGSYSGATCAWFRLRYPSKSSGCVGESAVVNAILDFTRFDAHVFDVVHRYNPACSDALMQSTDAMERLFSAGRKEFVKSVFRADSLNDTRFGDSDFWYMIADQSAMMVQYGAKTALCSGLANLTSSPSDEDRLQNLNAVLVDHYGADFASDCFYNSRCLRHDRGEEGMARSWRWQKCSQVAYLQSAPSVNSLRSSALTLEELEAQCHYIFPEALLETPIPRTAEFDRTFGGSTPAYDGAGSNIVFLDYSDDPWMECSPMKALPGLPYCLTTCDDCGHCGAGVTEAEGRRCQQQASAALSSWLGPTVLV